MVQIKISYSYLSFGFYYFLSVFTAITTLWHFLRYELYISIFSLLPFSNLSPPAHLTIFFLDVLRFHITNQKILYAMYNVHKVFYFYSVFTRIIYLSNHYKQILLRVIIYVHESFGGSIQIIIDSSTYVILYLLYVNNRNTKQKRVILINIMFYYFHKHCIIYVKLHFIVFVNGRDYEGQNLKISSGVE